MNKVLLIVIFLGVGWYGNLLYKEHGLAFVQNLSSDSTNSENVKCVTKDGRTIYGTVPNGTVCEKIEVVKGALMVVPSESFGGKEGGLLSTFSDSNHENMRVSNYNCDGRIYCSQMNSCEEAMYFLNNCTGVKMDGNNDGVPCEKQWCR